jgi:hypothetical protein
LKPGGKIAFRRPLPAEGARMWKKSRSAKPWLQKKAAQGFRGYPIATVAFYGPTADLATKIVVAIMVDKDREPDPLERWFTQDVDIRSDRDIGIQIVDFIKGNNVKSVIVTDKLIGCPHEEGIDYPDGKSCPKCPFWAGRDRFTHERIQ